MTTRTESRPRMAAPFGRRTVAPAVGVAAVVLLLTLLDRQLPRGSKA